MSTLIVSVTPKQKQRLGKFLKQKRLSNKVSVTTLSSIIDRSGTYYYGMENGTVKLHATIIKRLFDFYGVKYESSK